MLISRVMRLWDREIHVPLEETKAGTVISVILSLISIGALSVCLSRRVQNVRDWSRLPLVCWLVLVIYIDSIAFVAGTAILSNGFGVSSSASMCSRAILLCLGCYMTTKLLYYFLVERVYIIRRSPKSRLKDPLYLFNSFGMLVPYLVVIVLNFYFRFAIYENGTCRIGMKRVAMIPLITFDVLVNVYLTCLFLMPLRATYSYKNNRTSSVRTVALRTFVGSCATLLSSVVNLTMVVVLNGEPGWVCLMCCNCDILFSVLVLHWITSKDNASTISTSPHPTSSKPTANLPNSNNANQHSRITSRVHMSDAIAYETNMREQKRRQGVVTTMVTANEDCDDEYPRIELPKNVITVESMHIREVFEMRDVNGEGRDSASSGSGSGGNEGRKVRSESTDDFFRKY